MQTTYETIKEKAAHLQFKNQAYINGRYISAKSGKTFDCINPATGQILTSVAACDAEDINEAVRYARKAFEGNEWSNLSPQDRKKILLQFAELLEQHQFELALLETLDMGKPIGDSLNSDVPSAIRCVRWYAEAIDKVYDKIAPTAQDVIAMITREPLGVVGAVLPWNFPLYLACLKIAPVLAAGNCIILKPAEQSPLTTLRIAELASEAGIPDGVLNVIPGYGETAGRALGLHPDVDAISFTGSTEIGKLFMKYSAESNLKRIFLECGGKSPNIVMADCTNLTEAAKAAVKGAFYNQGEVCCAPTRLIIDEKIKDQFLEKIFHFSQDFQPNDPLNPSTKMGALVDKNQFQRVLNFIDEGKKEGAQLVLGGQAKFKETGGYFIEPTVFDNVQNNMTIAREEIFGPVLSVISFKNIDEAIKIANDTHYGLAAYLWTNDINKAHKTAKALRAGVVGINSIDSGDITTPFGGYKQSGIGRESAIQGLEHYTEIKTTWIELH